MGSILNIASAMFKKEKLIQKNITRSQELKLIALIGCPPIFMYIKSTNNHIIERRMFIIGQAIAARNSHLMGSL
jgi:hypothetical protein